MNFTKLFELLSYTFPAIIIGIMAYSIFNSYFKDQQNTRRWLIQKKNQKKVFPIRLQAYERITLLMERISPKSILVRIAPTSDNKNEYATFIINQIEQEFEHNLSQQIYVSNECWSIITTAKNTTIQIIHLATKKEEIMNSHQLREYILNDLFQKKTPSNVALEFLKNEINQLW